VKDGLYTKAQWLLATTFVGKTRIQIDGTPHPLDALLIDLCGEVERLTRNYLRVASKSERDDEIARLHNDKGLSFGRIGKLMDPPMKTPAVKMAYRRHKERNGNSSTRYHQTGDNG
jgi:hypothetical protein